MIYWGNLYTETAKTRGNRRVSFHGAMFAREYRFSSVVNAPGVMEVISVRGKSR
ncbi:MAG: hypothetical protein ACYC4H_12435 [Desulfocucumaceae bacterium]